MSYYVRDGELRIQKWLLRSFLIGGVLIHQVGCGIEGITVPLIVTGATVTAAAAVAVHELADMERVKLDIELKRIELQGRNNGQHLSTYRYLTDEEVRKCVGSGRVIVNGVSTPVTLAR